MLKYILSACCLYALVATPVIRAQDDGLINLMRQAIENNPELRAVRERNLERYPTCASVGDVAGNASKADARAWRMVGRCAELRNRLATAENAFRRAAELDPTAENYSLLAMALVRQKKLPEAVPVLRKAAELDSHEDQLFRAWGAYYLEDGDLKRAAAYYQKALDILYPHGPGFLEGDPDYETLAGIYAKLGDHSAALAAFRETCFAYVCPDDETYYRYGVEMKAAGLRDELRDLIDSAELGHEAVAKRLQALSAAR